MRRDYRVVRGTDWTATGLIARDRNGAVINLTGASITSRLGPRGRHSTSVSKTVGSGITVTDAVNGVYSRNYPGVDTANLTPGAYRYADEVTVGGVIHPPVNEGVVFLERDLP